MAKVKGIVGYSPRTAQILETDQVEQPQFRGSIREVFTKSFISLAVMAAVIAAVAVSTSALAGFGGVAAPVAGKCFPASKWGATAGERPCVEVTRVYEDGSFKFRVADANGTTRYSGGVGAADR